MELLTILKTLVRKKQVAVLMSMHELDLAQKVSDYIVCVGENKIWKCGMPEEIFTAANMEALFGIRAESYQDLVNDLLLLLTGGAKEGTVWLYAGSEPMDASAAAERACKEVQQETPLGAYAVEYLTYTVDDSARNYTAIQLTIGYRRTPEQIASMVYTTSISALHDLLTSAARSGSGELVVQVGYFDHQEEQVRAIVDQVQAMEAPEEKEPWTVNFYPEGGDVGIIEIILKKS